MHKGLHKVMLFIHFNSLPSLSPAPVSPRELSQVPSHLLLKPTKTSDFNVHPSPCKLTSLVIYFFLFNALSSACWVRRSMFCLLLVGHARGHVPQIRTHNRDIVPGQSCCMGCGVLQKKHSLSHPNPDLGFFSPAFMQLIFSRNLSWLLGNVISKKNTRKGCRLPTTLNSEYFIRIQTGQTASVFVSALLQF